MGVAIVISGGEGFALEGRRVVESVLSSVRSVSISVLCMWSSRTPAPKAEVWEYHAGWCALKLPRMMESPWAWVRKLSDGEKFGGQEDTGGM